jgi:hypothetical protein
MDYWGQGYGKDGKKVYQNLTHSYFVAITNGVVPLNFPVVA